MNYSVPKFVLILCLFSFNTILHASGVDEGDPDETKKTVVNEDQDEDQGNEAPNQAAAPAAPAATAAPAASNSGKGPAKQTRKTPAPTASLDTASSGSNDTPAGRTRGTNYRKRLTPSEVEMWVARLPKVFDNAFREQYRKSLLNGEVPDLPGDTPDAAKPASGGLTVDLGATDRPAAPPKETMGQRIVNVVEIPESNTRVYFVERSRPTTPSPAATKKDEPTPSAAKADNLQAAQANAGGMPTIIASRSSGPAWEMSGTPIPKWDTARAERGFKAFDTYLAAPQGPAAPDVAGANGAAKPDRKKESGGKEKEGWTDQIVYIDDEPTEETAAANAAATRREIAAESWEASLRGNDNSFALMARDTFYSLRKKAYTTPLAGILVNLLLMISGLVLMFLMMAKRRRIATAGYPPVHPRREAPPPVPASALHQTQTTARDDGFFLAQTPPTTTDPDSVDTKTDLTAHPAMQDDIRVVFDPRLCRWVLRREEYGRLGPVLAELQVGTVVRGSALGTGYSAADKRYRLSLTNTWIPTVEEEQIIIAVKAQNFRTGR